MITLTCLVSVKAFPVPPLLAEAAPPLALALPLVSSTSFIASKSSLLATDFQALPAASIPTSH